MGFYWLKSIKKFLSRFFVSFFASLGSGSTLMITSSEPKHKSIFSFISYKVLFLLVIGIIFLIGSSVHFYSSREGRVSYLVKMHQDSSKMENRITRLNDQVVKLNEYDAAYSERVTDIFKLLGNVGESDLWNVEKKLVDIRPEFWERYEKINAFNVDETIKVLNQNRLNQLINLEHLKDVGNFNRLRAELINDIPIGWPIANNKGYKTSDYGPRVSPFTKRKEFHAGIDLASAQGNYIVATAAGRVFIAESKGGFGKVIMIRHKYGYRTVYGHNYKNLVKAGDIVKKNQRIATVGMTGRATGPHTHYEIRIGRQHVDPWDYVIAKF